jgi:hypothetical protein
MINIVVQNMPNSTNFIDPIDCFGAPHGKVFQQWFEGKPLKTYLIGAGHCERPITIWYDDESSKYRLASESKKDLKAFVDSVKYVEVQADVRIDLRIK